MKHLFIAVCITLSTFAIGQSSKCSRIETFGNKQICLPITNGMTECYDEFIIKELSEIFKGSPQEKVLGIYVNDDNYLSGERSGFEYGLGYPYIKIYSTIQAENFEATSEIIDLVGPELKKTFDNFSGSNLESKQNMLFHELSKKLDMKISIDSPILLEEYQVIKGSKSFLTIMEINYDEEATVACAVMNILIVKERLIFVVYYDHFKGAQYLTETKAANDYFIMKMMVSN